MVDLSRFSDRDLIAASRRSPAAFGALYERHAEAVMRYLWSRTQSAEAAADLTAEVFAAALQATGRFRLDRREPVRAWLFGIANHKLADSRRHHRAETRARARLGIEPRTFNDEELEEVEERLSAGTTTVEALVTDLPPEQRAAVLGRIVEEREYADLAVKFQVSEPTVRQRVSRGLARLARGL